MVVLLIRLRKGDTEMTKIRKNNTCKNCGSECFSYSFFEDGSLAWECNCCHKKTKRQRRFSKLEKKLIAELTK